jgi:tetratricopeptide (TPR) repeat protein
MARLTVKLLTLTALGLSLVAIAPVLPVFAAGGGDPGSPDQMRPAGSSATSGGTSTPPPRATRSSHRAKKDKQSFLDAPAFRQGYHEAYVAIYDRHDYAAAIDQLHALGHDDYANIANLIGYSYRKLGDYKLSQVWYERALKSDPNHVLTWNYYGLWQIEQGNRDQAEYHLSRIAEICGTDCTEYRSLAAALEQPPGIALVY